MPPILRSLTEDIACYFTLRGSFTQDGASRNDYADAYKEAMDVLLKISEGDIALTLTDGSIVPALASGRILSSNEGYTPIFGRDEPTNWNRDSDEVADTEAARS